MEGSRFHGMRELICLSKAAVGHKPGISIADGSGSVAMSFLGLINDNSTNHACRATDYRPGGRTTAGHRSYRGAGAGADGPTAQHPLFGRAHAGAAGD